MFKNITKGEVWEFVRENLVTADNRRMACGDGRYEPEQSEGAIRAFGADFGMIMAFSAALKDEGIVLSPEDIVNRYTKAKQGVFGEEVILDYHTDTHAQKEGGIGCGHIAKASDPAHDGLYGSLNHKDIQDLYTAFINTPKSELTVLDGHHEEEGVLFVHGTPGAHDVTYSIASKDRKRGKIYFVVDMDRINGFIEQMVPLFSEGLPKGVNAVDVKRNYETQMGATAKLLGADKLDHYRIAVDEKGHFIMEQISKKAKTSN